jgi:hypothetical protein
MAWKICDIVSHKGLSSWIHQILYYTILSFLFERKYFFSIFWEYNVKYNIFYFDVEIESEFHLACAVR